MVTRWWAEAVRPRLLLAGHLRSAGGRLVGVLLAVNLLLGLLPVAFVVATSVLVGRVPEAVTAGVGSAAWEQLTLAFVVATVTFLGQQTLTPVQIALGELVKRRVDGAVHDRLIAAALSSTGIGPMEDQAALDALVDASRKLESNWETPGMGGAGLLALVARYTRLAGFVVLVGAAVSWPAAVALTIAATLFRYGNRGGLRRYSQVWAQVVRLIRRGRYLRELAVGDRAAKELRVYGLTGWLADRYERAYRTWLAPIWRARRKEYLLPFLAYTTVGLAVAVGVFALIAHRAAAGDVPLTGLALGLQATVAVVLLGEYYPESDSATQFGMLTASAVGRFEAEMASAVGRQPDGGTPEGRRAHTPDPAAVSTPAVRFENLTFRYPGSGRDVLAGLDITLAAGRCTAVVGVNGAGKTTLVKLLTRLYEPTAGAVRFGETDIRTFGVAAWRRQVSVIFQDFVRYDLSIADNVAFGAVHKPRDLDRVRRAVARAGLREVFDQLPDGLDTPLSRAYPGGIDLSGGQWQRVAIARSLYGVAAGARVLVLDEPTAALDVRAEAAFFAQFVELTRGVTSLLISHRFSSVRHADHIVVLDGGHVVEQGTHDALVAAGGRYAALFDLQAERFARGTDGGRQR